MVLGESTGTAAIWEHGWRLLPTGGATGGILWA
jgi:hypothetical protein